MATKFSISRRLLAETRGQWPLMSMYERFEQVVAIVHRSGRRPRSRATASPRRAALISGAIDPLDHEMFFQTLFGMVMTLLIALEFKHSIVRVALRQSNIVQVKTVVLISLIALSHKFVILDTKAMSAGTIAALTGATLSLG